MFKLYLKIKTLFYKRKGKVEDAKEILKVFNLPIDEESGVFVSEEGIGKHTKDLSLNVSKDKESFQLINNASISGNLIKICQIYLLVTVATVP